jgi:hypothetical protein
LIINELIVLIRVLVDFNQMITTILINSFRVGRKC